MPPFSYVGRAPDSDATIIPKNFADTTNSNTQVTTSYINSQLNPTLATLATPTYVTNGAASRVTQATVNSALANYVANTQLGAASTTSPSVTGVATLGSTGQLTAGQVPSGTLTDRVSFTVAATSSTIYLASGSNHTVTTTVPTEFKLASVTISDPGWPWRPLPFANVMGMAAGTASTSRNLGNGNYGLLTCAPPTSVSSTVYGAGVCSAVYNVLDFYQLLPYALANQTPLTVPAINGSLELDLYCSNWTGNNYTFSGTGLTFWVWVVPAL